MSVFSTAEKIHFNLSTANLYFSKYKRKKEDNNMWVEKRKSAIVLC